MLDKSAFRLVLGSAWMLGACSVYESPSPQPLTPMLGAEQLRQLEISTTAVSVLEEHTGGIKGNAALTRYMETVADGVQATVNAKLVRHGYGMVVSIPARGMHTPTLENLTPTLQREPGLQIFVVGNSVFERGSPQCARVASATTEAVSFLKRRGIAAPRMWSIVTCDQIPTTTFDKDDWERDERVEFVIYPSRALVNSMTKSNAAPAQPKNP